jgi:hypothetical protein
VRYKHPHAEKPRHDYCAQPTPAYEDFETVTLSVSIYGTGTRIEQDMPTVKARAWAAEILAACDIVDDEQLKAALRRRHA